MAQAEQDAFGCGVTRAEGQPGGDAEAAAELGGDLRFVVDVAGVAQFTPLAQGPLLVIRAERASGGGVDLAPGDDDGAILGLGRACAQRDGQ